MAIVGLGAPSVSLLIGILFSLSGKTLDASVFVVLPAALAVAGGVVLRRPTVETLIGTVVAGFLGGLSAVLAGVRSGGTRRRGAVADHDPQAAECPLR